MAVTKAQIIMEDIRDSLDYLEKMFDDYDSDPKQFPDTRKIDMNDFIQMRLYLEQISDELDLLEYELGE